MSFYFYNAKSYDFKFQRKKYGATNKYSYRYVEFNFQLDQEEQRGTIILVGGVTIMYDYI